MAAPARHEHHATGGQLSGAERSGDAGPEAPQQRRRRRVPVTVHARCASREPAGATSPSNSMCGSRRIAALRKSARRPRGAVEVGVAVAAPAASRRSFSRVKLRSARAAILVRAGRRRWSRPAAAGSDRAEHRQERAVADRRAQRAARRRGGAGAAYAARRRAVNDRCERKPRWPLNRRDRVASRRAQAAGLSTF